MPTKPTAVPSRPIATKAAANALRAKPLNNEASASAAAPLEVVPLANQPSERSVETTPATDRNLQPALAPSASQRSNVPMWSGHQFTTLLSNYTAQHCHNSMATTAFNPVGDVHTWAELMALQQATAQRLMQQQMNGINGLMSLFQERRQVKQANTLSKWFEQECYWFASLNALLASQATNMVSLMENIQIDYGYWAAQKTARES